MIKIKLTTSFTGWPLLVRQTLGSKGIWGNCQFFENQDVKECDFWVVYEGLLKLERTICPPANTILITGEPSSIKEYNKKYLSQFGTVITFHRGLEHPNIINTHPSMPWRVGMRIENTNNISYSKAYGELKAIKRINKDKLISVISSNKTITEGHRKRLYFVEKLARHFGPRLDVYGFGVRAVADTWDAISRYKYYIAIENSSFHNYWTEKLSDAFLCGSYPFYHGCPNIHDYFPEGSLTCIDINDLEKSVAIIEKAIENRQYEESINEINDARDMVLDKYNLFPMLCDLFNNINPGTNKVAVDLSPEETLSPNIAKRLEKWIYLRAKNFLGH